MDPQQELANRLRHGFRTLMAGRDADLAYGRTLPRRLRHLGLVDVGVATAAEIDEHLDNVRAGRVPDLATSPMITAWGRRP